MKAFGPGATIGILGGGQLGRMMALAARRMGYRIVVLDPNPRCPTAQVSDGVVVGALDDVDAAIALAAQVDVITLDTEHVPAEVLAEIEKRKPVRPGAGVLQVIQDRRTQKEFLDELGLPQARWAPASTADELRSASSQVAATTIAKVRRAGYDGKGQVRLPPGADIDAAWKKLRGEPVVVEELVPFVREISIIFARSVHGDVCFFPLAENVHRNHVLHTTRAPAPISAQGQARAEAIATTIAHKLGHVGVMAVELFELADGTLLVNEIAPRTHNSGHYTYGACATSQFEQHVRAICGQPLGDPRALSGAVMVNLIGDLWTNRADGTPVWDAVLACPSARLHLYGKERPAPGRKMGHVVVLDDDTARGLQTVEAMVQALATQAKP